MSQTRVQADGPAVYTDTATIPKMPADLLQWEDGMAFDPADAEDMQLVHGIATQAYAAWAQNGYQRVQVSSVGFPRPACVDHPQRFDVHPLPKEDYTVSLPVMGPDGAQQVDADGRVMYTEEFFTLQYQADEMKQRINVAMGKRDCAGCPLQVQCLASAITQYKYNRDGEFLLVPLDDPMLYGGYGPNARGLIFDAFVSIWNADPESPADPGNGEW